MAAQPAGAPISQPLVDSDVPVDGVAVVVDQADGNSLFAEFGTGVPGSLVCKVDTTNSS